VFPVEKGAHFSKFRPNDHKKLKSIIFMSPKLIFC